MSFIKHRQTTKWCNQNFLNWHGLQKAINVRQHLLNYMRRFLGQNFKPISCVKNGARDSLGDPTLNIRKCIVSGFFSQAAKLQVDGSYRTIRDQAVSFSILTRPVS
jgi:ATP-dependent RNA helicase DDX35